MPILTTLLRPCSNVVVIVWAVPVPENIFVTPIPISVSLTNLFNVSFVRLCWVLSTTTLPIVPGTANDFVSAGSETGVSLLVWGYKSLTGWENDSLLNGVTVGLLDEFATVK